MPGYGLIGEKLGHSFSPILHEKFNNKDYGLFAIPKEEIDEYFKKADFNAVNVTIPYKETAMKYCEVDDTAKAIGCVNTLVNVDGKVYGYNTDYLGFNYMVNLADISITDKRVIILGSGGTSKTACYTVAKMGAKSIVVVSRSAKAYDIDVSCPLEFISYDDIETCTDYEILVNTTPVGMFPDNYKSPINLDIFSSLEGVVDVIYNPLTTKLVSDARAKSIKSTNGLPMLVAQAWYAERLFFSQSIEIDEKGTREIEDVLDFVTKLKQNIVLVGMPGSGKTTIGNTLVKKLNRKLIDTDEVFEEKTGIHPGDYITKYGEAKFRDVESEVVFEVAKENGCIIATGGGSILRSENVKALKQNGCVIYLHSELKDLATDNRPLSQGYERRKGLFYKRLPIYMSICDYKVIVDGDADSTADRLLEEMNSKEKKMKLLVLNGPNINMLGIREPGIYGNSTYSDLVRMCEEEAKKLNVEVEFFQSNHEGDLVDVIQKSYGNVDGIVFNPAAYTHTSVAILDAVKAVSIPTVEVHISDPDGRDEFRKISYVRNACVATIKGHGLLGYLEAMQLLVKEYMNV